MARNSKPPPSSPHASNAAIAQIHDRMPAVIHPENFAQWLDIKNVDAEEAAQFLKPAPEDYFVFEPTVIERALTAAKTQGPAHTFLDCAQFA